MLFLKKKLLSWLSGEEAACNAGDTGDAGSVPGQEDPLEKEVDSEKVVMELIHSRVFGY